ncbi:MAG: hypothetical protein VZQ81_00245 [Succiniclasticum sp.]|jgi:hypothetical protein|nr:hypothetical protein [Succiniclasticum sp.]MEE3478443.1 hypothetical protein [Succiniclasticum sp.]
MERKKRQPVHGESMNKFYQVRTSPEELEELKKTVKEIKAMLPYARVLSDEFPYSTTSDILLASLQHYKEYLRVYLKR